MPWLNVVDPTWLWNAVEGFKTVFCLENHADKGGLSDEISRIFSQSNEKAPVLSVMAVEGFAQSGQVDETLKAYHLYSDSIAARIQADFGGNKN